ncbi:hypothetical protein DXG01_007323 [Tephrocybe rancida]|nr:hypothetical protein DXG01_007323 [Tephrocybe rancida]
MDDSADIHLAALARGKSAMMDAFLKKDKGREILNILEGRSFSTSDNDFALADDPEVRDRLRQEKKVARKANKAAGAAKAKAKKSKKGKEDVEIINSTTEEMAADGLNTQSGDMNIEPQEGSSTTSTTVEPPLGTTTLPEVMPPLPIEKPVQPAPGTPKASIATTTPPVAPAAPLEIPPTITTTPPVAVVGTTPVVPAAPNEIQPSAIATSAGTGAVAHKAPIRTYGKPRKMTPSAATVELMAAADKLAKLQVHAFSTSAGQDPDAMEVDDHPCTSPNPPADDGGFMDGSGPAFPLIHKSSLTLKTPPRLAARRPAPGSPDELRNLKRQKLAQNHVLFSQLIQEDSTCSGVPPGSDPVKLRRTMEIHDSSDAARRTSSMIPRLLLPHRTLLPMPSQKTLGSSRGPQRGSSSHEPSSPVLRHAAFLKDAKDKGDGPLGAPPVVPSSRNPFQMKTKK